MSDSYETAKPRAKAPAQVPPAAIDFERAICAAVLTDPAALPLALEHMAAADCYDERHVTILKAAIECHRLTGSCEMLSVGDRLKAIGKDELVTFAYLVNIALAPGTTAAVAHYARKVRQCSYMRAALVAGHRLLVEGYDPRCDPDAFAALWGNLARRVEALTPPDGSEAPTTFGEQLSALYDKFCNGEVLPPAIPTGLEQLDKALGGGFRAGRLYVIGGRPGHGKTSLALGALRTALALGKHAAFVSLEMANDELQSRMVSAVAGFDITKAQSNQHTQQQVFDAASTVAGWHCRMIDRPAMTLEAIEAWLNSMADLAPLDLIVIDNLQDVQLGGGFRAIHEQLDGVVRRFKQIAKRLKCPLLLLAQAKRDIDDRGVEGYYRKADIADTKALEGAADVLLFCWQPPADDETLPEGYAELQIVKQRAGKMCNVRANFDANTQSFLSSYDGYCVNRKAKPAPASTPRGKRQPDWAQGNDK